MSPELHVSLGCHTCQIPLLDMPVPLPCHLERTLKHLVLAATVSQCCRDSGERIHISLQKLGLSSRCLTDVSIPDLKASWHRCALLWHPDRHGVSDKPMAEAKFREAQEAYRFLHTVMSGCLVNT